MAERCREGASIYLAATVCGLYSGCCAYVSQVIPTTTLWWRCFSLQSTGVATKNLGLAFQLPGPLLREQDLRCMAWAACVNSLLSPFPLCGKEKSFN